MATITNYYAPNNDYAWTSARDKNQMWSFFRVTRAIYINKIDIHWGGYDRPTKGRHFIAQYTGNSIGKILAMSEVINVSQGRKWRSANVPYTRLEPGMYAVGIWGDYYGRRAVSQYIDSEGLLTFTRTTTRLTGNVDGLRWRARGVIPSRLSYEPAGRTRVKVGSTWREGQAHIKVGSTWRRAQAIWVKVGSTWRRGT